MVCNNIVQPGRGHFVFPNKQELSGQGWMAISPSSLASKTRKQVAKGKVGVFLPLSCQQHTARSTELFRPTRCSRATFALQFLHFLCLFHMNFIVDVEIAVAKNWVLPVVLQNPNQQDSALNLLPCAVCRAERQALSTLTKESRK